MIAIEAVPKNHRNTEISQNTKEMMETVQKIKIEGLTRKLAIDELMNEFKDQGFVNLLASNIVYEGESGESVKWGINLNNIKENFDKLLDFDASLPAVKTPLLGFRGGNSQEVVVEDY